MELSSRRVRLGAAWLLILPFLWFARPTGRSLWIGGVLAAVGLCIRALSAGHIHKERVLTTTGPYAHTRNPLYLGTLLLGLGVTAAGGRWIWVGLFVAFFWVVYGRTIRAEADKLQGLFGDAYAQYAQAVPLFVPRLTPYREPGTGCPAGFSPARYRRNREYQALLGALAGFAFLAARMIWF